jgi:hypothetical protein
MIAMSELRRDIPSMSTLNEPQIYNPATGPNKIVLEYLAKHSPIYIRLVAARKKVIALAMFNSDYLLRPFRVGTIQKEIDIGKIDVKNQTMPQRIQHKHSTI